MAIYTKKGDKGETALFDQDNAQRKRVSKDSVRVEAIGAIDELNSYLGVVIVELDNPETTKELQFMQKKLLTIGSILSGSNLRFTKVSTKKLEKEIDKMESELPILKNFVLPGGTKVAANLHFARTLARRTERSVVALGNIEEVKPQILTFLNRLSDYLFTLARWNNFVSHVNEETWKGKTD